MCPIFMQLVCETGINQVVYKRDDTQSRAQSGSLNQIPGKYKDSHFGD